MRQRQGWPGLRGPDRVNTEHRSRFHVEARTLISVGDVVEWTPAYRPGTMRGTVTRIAKDGRVYLTINRINDRRRVVGSEVWFDAHERNRLHVVTDGEWRSRS